MSSSWSSLKIELMEAGQNNNSWGGVTNTNLGTTIEQAIVGMATISSGFTTNVATLTLADTNALQNARALVLNVTATLTGAGTLNVPAIQKPYVIFNSTGYALTVKVSGGTGVTVPNGKRTVVYNNGTDVGEQITYLNSLQIGTLTLSSALPVVSGGTGASTLTGLVKGNGTSAMTAAVAGTDYSSGTGALATGIVKSTTSTGALSIAVAGTDYLVPPSGTAILKANSGGALANATAGTDYVAPGTATSFTAKQTFTGAATTIGASLQAVLEKANVSATAATGTIAFNVNTAVVWYYTTNASANWTVNIQGDGSNTLNSLMATGESLACAFLVTTGATAYYNSAVQVDGTTSGVATKWQGGSAPNAGFASSINVYTYTVIKTGNAAFTVLASLTQFK
jgi:hypothetical protein